MCHTQFKKQKIIWSLTFELISVKTHQMKKVNTYLYSLKNKKLNMQIGQLWSVVNFFVKINRLFLIRDAKFKMNQKNDTEIPLIHFFLN
jgi:uncharacterized membrane protein